MIGLFKRAQGSYDRCGNNKQAEDQRIPVTVPLKSDKPQKKEYQQVPLRNPQIRTEELSFLLAVNSPEKKDEIYIAAKDRGVIIMWGFFVKRHNTANTKRSKDSESSPIPIPKAVAVSIRTPDENSFLPADALLSENFFFIPTSFENMFIRILLFGPLIQIYLLLH